MTVLLILATIIAFLTLDYFYSRRRAVAAVGAGVNKELPAPGLAPAYVAGFALPGNFRYHPGHTWAVPEGPTQVRIGLDDFAARLIGKAAQISLPRRGQWIRQGQKVWSVQRDGKEVGMVSPIEGMITEINEAAAQNPALALRDPYGDGWLVSVHSPDAKTNFRNLLGGGVARRWMDEAAARLSARMPALAGAVAQDGGLAVSDLSAQLPEAEWEALTREFFLS